MAESGLIWNGDQAIAALRGQVGKNLLDAAEFLEKTHYIRLGVYNPPPYHNSSKVGEIRKRTGFGRDALTHEPQTAEECAKAGFCLVSIEDPKAWYMDFLAQRRGRKGLQQTFLDIQPKLLKILKSGFDQPAAAPAKKAGLFSRVLSFFGFGS